VGEPYPIVWWVMGVGGLGSVSQPMCTMNDAEVCQEATIPTRWVGAFAHRSSRRTWPCPHRVASIGCALFGRLKRAQEVLDVPYAHKTFGPSTPRTKICCGSKGLSRARVDLSREHSSLPTTTTTTKKADLRQSKRKGK
jgi:hypothetical protein